MYTQLPLPFGLKDSALILITKFLCQTRILESTEKNGGATHFFNITGIESQQKCCLRAFL